MQEDKEPLFDSVETIVAMLEVSAEFALNITFDKARISKSLPGGHLDATTMADYLVYKVLEMMLWYNHTHTFVWKLMPHG